MNKVVDSLPPLGYTPEQKFKVKLTVKDRKFTEVRCNGCKALLYKISHKGGAVIEVKCRRCGDVSVA